MSLNEKIRTFLFSPSTLPGHLTDPPPPPRGGDKPHNDKQTPKDKDKKPDRPKDKHEKQKSTPKK